MIACSSYFPEVGELRADGAAGPNNSGASSSSSTSSSSSSSGATGDSNVDGAPVDAGLDAPTKTWTVVVGPNDNDRFDPKNVTIGVGDTVKWVWLSGGHSLASGAGSADGLFCAPSNTACSSADTLSNGSVYSYTFPTAGVFPYFCPKHKSDGMNGSVTVQ